MGVPQYMSDEKERVIKAAVEKAYEYVWKGRFSSCRNEFRECAWFAASGHCESNPALLEKECAPVCQTCKKEVTSDDYDFEDDDDDDDSGGSKERPKKPMNSEELTLESDSHVGISPFKTNNAIYKAPKESPCDWSEEDNIWKTPGYIDDIFQAQKYGQWYSQYHDDYWRDGSTTLYAHFQRLYQYARMQVLGPHCPS